MMKKLERSPTRSKLPLLRRLVAGACLAVLASHPAATWRASQMFEAGDFPAAEIAYGDILRAFPGDILARLMMAESARQAAAGLAEAAQT